MIPETRRERAGWTLTFITAIGIYLAAFVALMPGCTGARYLPPIDTRLTTMLESAVFISNPGSGCGSAFVISSELSDGSDGLVPAGKYRTLVLTAGHMLELNRPIHAANAFGKDLGDARAYWNCDEFDIAVIEFDLDQPMRPVTLRREPLRAGEHVWLCGFPWGQPASITSGYVGDPRIQDIPFPNSDLKGGAILRLVLFGDPGNSGSPVFDDNGEVVGVLTLGFGAPGTVNGIVALAHVGVRNWVEFIMQLHAPYWSGQRPKNLDKVPMDADLPPDGG